jgi:hypothetical protein
MALQNKIQTFNDGVVRIYDVSNSASPGDMPVEALTLKETLRYHERTVGITRQSAAKQDNAEIKYVLRCPRRRNVSAQDVAIPNDGSQYRIWAVQYPEDIHPPVMDLTLQVITAVFDIYQPEGEKTVDES